MHGFPSLFFNSIRFYVDRRVIFKVRREKGAFDHRHTDTTLDSAVHNTQTHSLDTQYHQRRITQRHTHALDMSASSAVHNTQILPLDISALSAAHITQTHTHSICYPRHDALDAVLLSRRTPRICSGRMARRAVHFLPPF